MQGFQQIVRASSNMALKTGSDLYINSLQNVTPTKSAREDCGLARPATEPDGQGDAAENRLRPLCFGKNNGDRKVTENSNFRSQLCSFDSIFWRQTCTITTPPRVDLQSNCRSVF